MFEQELAPVPIHPPRNSVLPRMRLAAAIPRSTLILLAAVVVLFGVFPLSIMSTEPGTRLELGSNRTAEGRVLTTTDAPGCAAGAHRIVYSFSAASGREFRGSRLLCEQSPYYDARAGDAIQVRYLESDPTVSTIAGTDSAAPPLFLFAFFPIFFLLVLSPLYWPQLRELTRARRLYKTGAVIEGKVVFIKRRSAMSWPGWPGSSHCDVYVAHALPNGGEGEAVAGCANDWLVNQLSPGTTVHILLQPGKSTRGVLLEAFIR